jgi:hypothetical protein
MPWRAPYLRYRRHPLALSVYFVVAALGFLLLTHLGTTSTVDAVIPDFVRVSWQVEMLVGGLGALVSCAMPPRFINGSLRVESAGSFLCACGLMTYSVAIQTVVGWTSPGWVLFFALAGGCAYRAVQIMFDERRLRRTAETLAQINELRAP